MSEDGFNHPRMNTYLKAEDLNLDGCLSLAEVILQDASEAYIAAKRAHMRAPHDKAALIHYRHCCDFYRSPYFYALSCGVVDGQSVIDRLDAEYERRMGIKQKGRLKE